MQKRVRTRNFVPCEKLLLAAVLEKYKDILKTKVTTKVANKQKEEAWAKIATEFNQVSTIGVYRSMEQLKTLWENSHKELRGSVDVECDNIDIPCLHQMVSPKRPRMEVDLTDICENIQLDDHKQKETSIESQEFAFRPIRLTEPANFAITPKDVASNDEEAQVRLKILEEQRLHQRELQVLEIKLARERIENERRIAAKTLELLNVRILKERSNPR